MASFTPGTITATKNPIMPNLGICDPHVHVFAGRAYLYASHDNSPANRDWIMRDWHIWSSDNLVDWTFESTFRPEDTYIGASSRCWAIDVAERKGRYYLYFSNGDKDTGVAVADAPGGPFHDALGRPLLSHDLTDTHQYDPTVFIDDDEAATPYLIWGSYKGSGYQIARLEESMTSLAERPQPIVLEGAPAQDDKNFLHKYNGRYYLSWASFYAASENLRGPYRYVGNLGMSHDHGSFFTWKNQWFCAFGLFDPTLYFRSTGLCYIHYRADGDMIADQLVVEHGVGHYDAAWQRIRAAWFMEATGIEKRDNHWSQIEVSVVRNEAFLHYPRIANVPANAQIAFYANSAPAWGALIEIREKSPSGRMYGSCLIPSSGNWGHWNYRVVTTQLSNPAGTLDLCLCVRGAGFGEILRLEYFQLRPNPDGAVTMKRL